MEVVDSFPHPNGTDSRLAWFVLFPCLGGFIGFAGYIVTALILESSIIPSVEPPKFTYGQQAGLISLPLSTIIGFSSGFALALFVVGMRRWSTVLMFAVAILGAFTTFSLWSQDGIGECNSAIVLYYPIFGLCALIAFIGIVLSLLAVVLSGRRLKQYRTQTEAVDG